MVAERPAIISPHKVDLDLKRMTRHSLFSLLKAAVLLVCIGLFGPANRTAFGSEIDNTIDHLTTTADWYFESGQDGAELGYSVSTAGDVNGDGFTDILVGSPLYTPPDPDGIYREGAAFVFYGGAGGLLDFPNWQASSGMQGCRFGSSVSSAGDVNGDGFDDVIIGADEYKLPFDGYNGEPKSGMVFLYLGSEDGLEDSVAWNQPAEAGEIAFGHAVASAGDVNHDGYDDVIIGAPYYESSAEEINEGKVYLFLGSAAGLATTPDWVFECDTANASCGYAVNTAGDINHDGYDDVIVGVPHYDNPATNAGAALIFFGSAQGLGDVPTWITGSDQEDAWFGESVAPAGDVNGDGFDDILIGASHLNRSDQLLDYGAAFIYLGSPTGIVSDYDWISYGSEQYSGFGRSVQSAGDINQDGFDDVLIGAYLFGQNGSLNQPDEGAAFLYIGGASGMRTSSIWAAYGEKAEAWFGFSAGAAGDINGDGGADLIVGAPKYRFDDRTIMGRAFVYFNTLEEFNYQVFIPFVTQ